MRDLRGCGQSQEDIMVVILQANLRGSLDQDLLDQFARDHNVDQLVLCEKYRNEENRF